MGRARSSSSKLGVICGGSGSSKFATALDRYFGETGYNLGFVCNVADNFSFHGLYVCPDVDIITYALAGKLDEGKGWGVRSDSHGFLKGLKSLGYESWFSLGDEDLALSVLRTEMMNTKGATLSEVTDKVRISFGIRHEIIPATDDSVQTHIETEKQGKIHLQEFWVMQRGSPQVAGVEYVGLRKALPNPKTIPFLSNNVLVFPANPVTSILPTLKLKGVDEALVGAKKVVAVSPFIGKSIFSGPGAKLMRAVGAEASSYGVAKLYSKFLKVFLVDKREEQSQVNKIKNDLGVECIRADIMVSSEVDRKKIAEELRSAF